MRILLLFVCLFIMSFPLAFAQTIQITEVGTLEQVYGETQESDGLLCMNELGLDAGGYVLYESEVEANVTDLKLAAENVRDYAVVYIDNVLTGGLTDEKKELSCTVALGKHRLQLYVENIGRITYGPEILDNSRGLFGTFTVNGKAVENWTITPLLVKDCDVDELKYSPIDDFRLPSFYRGNFTLGQVREVYLDMSGWGMGEVWVNGLYAGTYWEKEALQSVQLPISLLREGENQVVVFELKNNGKLTIGLSDKPVFK